MIGVEEVRKVRDGSGPWVSLAGSLLLMADDIMMTKRENDKLLALIKKKDSLSDSRQGRSKLDGILTD